jgi:prepilin-type N-terminal cleavage/methylation domain-containing protein
MRDDTQRKRRKYLGQYLSIYRHAFSEICGVAKFVKQGRDKPSFASSSAGKNPRNQPCFAAGRSFIQLGSITNTISIDNALHLTLKLFCNTVACSDAGGPTVGRLSASQPSPENLLMKRPFQFARRSLRRGLTLMELVVVMVILAAVAGIVLPLLPNMVTRAHTSTGATNISEVAKAIQTHQATHLTYPNFFDSLTTGPGVATYLPGATSGDFVVITATADHVDALDGVGITHLLQMNESAGGDWNPTFYPYGNDSTLSPRISHSTAIASTSQIATLSLTAKQRLGLNTDASTYVVFGLGGHTSMQGRSLQEAPVHFADNPNEGPNVAYGRYGVVFQLTNGTTALENAQFAQIVAFHDDGVVNLGNHLAEYHAATAP